MGKLVYVMGKSGTGKSRSMKNIPADMLTVINPEGKDFPFGKTSPAFKARTVVIDKGDDIVDFMKTVRTPVLVIDDFQTVMTNEFMRRSSEIGYQKWTDIGKHAWEIANTAKELPANTIVYIMCHTETDDNGNEKIKTLGKLLDQNVVLESKATIVLKTGVEDGKYFFYTQNNGKDTVKSPEGMFPSSAIDNDLKYVDDCIRAYYGMDGSKTDQQIADEADQHKVDVSEPAKAGRKVRRKKEEPAKAEEKEEDLPDFMNIPEGTDEEVPFEEYEAEKEAETTKRERKKRDIVPADAEPEHDTNEKVLTEDTYFHDIKNDNYLLKHAGDTVSMDGMEVIDQKTFEEGCNRISHESQAVPTNKPERTRRRRTRS